MPLRVIFFLICAIVVVVFDVGVVVVVFDVCY